MGMNLPELWQLRYFVAVAERLHFSRAAAALHVSQPPLSRAIRALEGTLGVALFARTRRRVELTRAGARLLEEAGRGKLAVSALAGEPFVMVPREIAPGLYDSVTGLAARAGISLNVAQEAIQMQTVVSLVSSGLGAAIVPASVANLGRRGVAYRELADRHPRLDVWLAWRKEMLDAPAREFISLARSLAS